MEKKTSSWEYLKWIFRLIKHRKSSWIVYVGLILLVFMWYKGCKDGENKGNKIEYIYLKPDTVIVYKDVLVEKIKIIKEKPKVVSSVQLVKVPKEDCGEREIKFVIENQSEIGLLPDDIKGDSVVVNQYDETYSDDNIDAKMTILTTGRLVSDVGLSYALKKKEGTSLKLYSGVSYSPRANGVYVDLNVVKDKWFFGLSDNIRSKEYIVRVGYKISF